jgi:MFS superfamily sulfate permease-like transporter
MLIQLNNELNESGIELHFARVADPVMDLFDRSGLLRTVGESRFFRGVNSAVAQFIEKGRLEARAESA